MVQIRPNLRGYIIFNEYDQIMFFTHGADHARMIYCILKLRHIDIFACGSQFAMRIGRLQRNLIVRGFVPRTNILGERKMT